MESTLALDKILANLYTARFSPKDKTLKAELWNTLVNEFLQKYIRLNSTVVDIGGGYCEFLNAVSAKEKHLIDLNPESQLFAQGNIRVHHLDILKANASDFGVKADYCFVSNFFEHLPDFQALLKVLSFIREILKPGGQLIIIQPNYRFAYKEYFDFIDHTLPISDRSLKEAVEAVGFKVDVLIPRFLPFSTKSRAASTVALKFYLKCPFFWRFFGKQLFMVVRPA
ncbi:MAG TPA: methyltransferase domain-containing protein [Oligoflexus sp.]|uniref:class I SAM-dependent methyltransferase n=1 Tax=Oligoflexus sp. TaxID=1971216 RepID=UPI002D75010A|nr:methyltransferase domain-containing protein [Oligoflexus sp.]HYX33199.1 methyltransferase domain-containing protein [Oligoflexus sp.]